MLRRLIALLTSVVLLLPSLQGSVESCMGHEGQASGAVMSHAEMAPDMVTAMADPAEDHGNGCPEPGTTGDCMAMPSCAALAALPMSVAHRPDVTEHGVVLPVAVTAPAAVSRAPELPPPRA